MKTWCLDDAVLEFEVHCDTLENVERYFQYVLRQLVDGSAAAAHLFLHEESNLVRCMFFCDKPEPHWSECVPLKPPLV